MAGTTSKLGLTNALTYGELAGQWHNNWTSDNEAIEARLAASYAGNPNGQMIGYYVGMQCFDSNNNDFYVCTTAGDAASAVWTKKNSGINTGDQTNITGNAGTVTTINGKIAAGSNVTITGSGTSASPYTIASAAGGTDSLFVHVFDGDNTGATNVTADLQTLIETAGANNEYVFIPAGTYWVQDLDPDSSCLLWAFPDSVTFIHEYNHPCISTNSWTTYQRNNTTQLSVTSIASALIPDGFGSTTDTDLGTELTVSSNSGVEVGDTWVITSNDSLPYSSSARVGEAFQVAAVSGSTKIYTTRLAWCNGADAANTTYLYTTSIKINKILDARKFHIYGINFTSKDTVVGNITVSWKDHYAGSQDVSRIEMINASTAKVTTAVPHNLTSGMCVRIQGAANAGYNVTTGNSSYNPNGIVVTSSTEFTYVVSLKTDSGGTNTRPTAPSVETTGITYNIVLVSLDGTNHGASMSLWHAPFAKIENCKAYNLFNMALRLSCCPFAEVLNFNTWNLPNTGTANANRLSTSRVGYGINIYGFSSGTKIIGGEHRQGRHAVTTGCAELTTYSSTNWYLQGQPTDCLVQGVTSRYAYGVPFDTHEETTGIHFKDCSVYYPARGPKEGSYEGFGVQIRCSNSRISNYFQKGGTHGIRYAATEQYKSEHYISSARFEDLSQGGSSLPSGAAITVEGNVVLTYPIEVKIDSLSVDSVGRIVDQGSDYNTSTVIIMNLFASRTQSYSTYTANTAKLTILNSIFDFSSITPSAATSRYLFNLNDTASVFPINIHIIGGNTASFPSSIFNSQDSVSGKSIFTPNITYENPSSVSAPRLITTGDESYFTNIKNPNIRTSVSSAATLNMVDDVLTINRAGAVAVSVTPKQLLATKNYTIKDISGGARVNNITITPTAGTIDGASSYVINTNYGAVTFRSDGTNLYVVAIDNVDIARTKTALTAASTAANTTKTTLQTASIDAGVFKTEKGVRIKIWGGFAANANNKTIGIDFGATNVFTRTNASNNTKFFIEALVLKTGTNTQDYISGGVDGTVAIAPTYGTATITETSAITVNAFGTNGTASANDITIEGMTIEVI